VGRPPGAAGQHVRAVGGLPGQGDGVADRADLHGDEVVELVAPVGGGGQAEPPPRSYLPDGVLERGGGDVVALVGDDQPVPGGQLRDVVAAGQCLQRDHVDGAPERAFSARRRASSASTTAGISATQTSYAAELPNECWQSDFTHYPLANGTDTKILTGTPEGVGPLTDGDEVPVTVELVGTLTNRVVIRD
jgi:hypothetical protein